MVRLGSHGVNTRQMAGTYLRVADPGWADPLDSSFAQRLGGRWNAPDAHATLYLNADPGLVRPGRGDLTGQRGSRRCASRPDDARAIERPGTPRLRPPQRRGPAAQPWRGHGPGYPRQGRCLAVLRPTRRRRSVELCPPTDPGGSAPRQRALGAPLLAALQRTFDLIETRLDRTSVNLPGGQQLQLADLPEAAVREAIVNGVMHRDYRRRGAVHVDHTATRLVVTSPGPFVSGVTVDNVLTTSSRSRNAALSAAIRMLGLARPQAPVWTGCTSRW